jgi:hypothetical protein
VGYLSSGGIEAPLLASSFSLGMSPIFSMEVETLLDGLTFAKERSIIGAVLGSVGPEGFFPRYCSNIAAISNLMEGFKESKDAKCSSLDTRELTRIGGGVS